MEGNGMGNVRVVGLGGEEGGYESSGSIGV